MNNNQNTNQFRFRHQKAEKKFQIFMNSFLYIGFWITAISAFFISIGINRYESDTWIGQDIFPFIILLLFLYAINFVVNENNERLVYLSVGLIFFLNTIPVVKYHFIYGTATDQAVHLSLIRSIQNVNIAEPESIYISTPGFHVLAGMFGIFAGLSPEVVSKLLSSLIGCMVPIGFFLFCHFIKYPNQQIKWVLFFAGLSTPLLYMLNGTRFTSGFFVIIILLIVTRELMVNNPKTKLGFTILILVFMSSLIFWHAGTTIILIITLACSGLLEFIFERSMRPSSRSADKYIQLGTLLLITAFTYWMYEADLVWTNFVRYIRLVLGADFTSDLIPTRISEVGVGDRIIVGLFYHARDMLLIGWAFIGLIFLFISPTLSQNTIRDIRKVYYFWLSTIFIIFVIFIVGFGSLGYQRFLVYPVSMSPMLAGFGFWRIEQKIEKISNKLVSKGVKIGVLILMLLFASIQLYPYQPIMPKLDGQTQAGYKSPPILFLHQVNTIYQYQMIDFLVNQLKPENQILADYFTQKQIYQFFGRDIYSQITSSHKKESDSAYILLHWPDGAGGFAEQAEFRSEEAISNWRNMVGISTIYDNGYSFILLHPANDLIPFVMEDVP